MSNFNCPECGTAILEDGDGRYVTGCEHYPVEGKMSDRHNCKGADFDVTGVMREPCYRAWTEHRDYWDAEGEVYEIGSFRCGFVHGYDAGRKDSGEALSSQWVPIRSEADLPKQRTRAVWVERLGSNYDTFRFLCPKDSRQWFVDTYAAYIPIPEYKEQV